MESHDNNDTTREEFEIKSATASVTDSKEDLEKGKAKTKQNDESREASEIKSSPPFDEKDFNPSTGKSNDSKEVNTSGNANVTEQSAEESETMTDANPISQCVSADISELIPELTLLLIGDPKSVEIGSQNILFDHDAQTNVQQFSSKLYDLCGRYITVINMLGIPNLDKFPVNQGIHAFLLLLPHGLHNSHYSSGLQWLETSFGKTSLSYVMTVVTHKSDDNCEGALTDLKANSSFTEKRYHTCTRSMTDEKELIGLLEKIDIMVSENEPQLLLVHYNSGLVDDEHEDQKEDLNHTSHKEEQADPFVFQQNQTVGQLGKGSSKSKCDSVNDLGDGDPSKNDDSTLLEDQCELILTSSRHDKGTLDAVLNWNEDKVGDTHNTVKISEEIDMKETCQTETERLLHRLDLQDKHQKKLTSADILKIGSPVKQEHVTFEKDLAKTFLHRLMMLDYRARCIPVRQDKKTSAPVSGTVDTEDTDLETFLSTSENTDPTQQTSVHPMDVQMAVYHCSDSFLKQNMVTKLSQCQFALPLLVPDPTTKDIECPLWTFRQIRKTWKINQDKNVLNTVTMKSMPICKAETPLVSFFRLGSPSVSKSQLINNLINDRHSTFFHRNCRGSTKSRHLMDGVAEIAWYCPAGKPDDAFNDCTAFCNLHGDALLIEKQRDILTEMSSVNVVLLPTLEKSDKNWTIIQDLYKSQKPLIILTTDTDGGRDMKKLGKYKIGLKDRSQPDVCEEVKIIIGEILSRQHTSFQLETMTEVSGIRVDEDDTVCQNAKSAAIKIVNLLEEEDTSKIKQKFLPCQGRLWHDWCRINKELYHLKGHIEKEKCKKQEILIQIRQDQCTASSSELIKLFIENLLFLSLKEREYFLKWIQILIDALSTDDLSSILQSYDEKWSEVLALKKKHNKSDRFNNKQMELEEISNKLQSATFGLEHIFREMGQIYEAHKTMQKPAKGVQTDWSKYPELAAELMISGHPMELMDGDAGHVPLTWISSLLDEVIRKLGDQRVFVLSVLGVQSSGKSTMLNAMFGLQFAVSAGRCTKGAFMQLVKVSEEMKKDFQFDYVLVVDTEGLRALELAGNTSLHRDNELATFVVGLGNMTLINIFGENPADMQDVLQIVVQAFMRMKKVKVSPSCVFVHQNVTDIAAAEKNMDGKRRLQEKLDQMTKLAAKEEGCDAECFSDVIAFDVQKDVKYFAQLWEGSPPMAPPNPGYSDSVQDLKNFILSKAIKSNGITLSQFKSKIHGLWNALLKENFVFSFKNTLEIAVYRKLEVQYANWTWTLRSNMLTIENQLHTRIENGKLDRIDFSFLHKEISKTYEEITKDMTAYFEDNEDKEMLVQWRGRFESKIKEFHDEHVQEVKRKLDEVLQQKNARKKVDAQKTEFEKKLLQKSKELAHQLKDKVKDEEELEKQFNSVWSDWVSELTIGIKPIEDINLEDDEFTILAELGIEWSFTDESGRCKNISEVGNYSDYVSITKKQEQSNRSQQLEDEMWENQKTKQQGSNLLTTAWTSLKNILGYRGTQQSKLHTSVSFLTNEDQNCIRSFIDNVEKQTSDMIKSKPVATRGYRLTYLQEVAKNVKDKVREFESQRTFALKKEFTVDLILYVFDTVESWLSESHKKYKIDNDAETFVKSKKTQYYNIFRSFCKGSSSAVVLGELICEKLKVSIVEAVCNKAAIDLAGEMRSNFPAFNGNRLNLEKHVLKSLAEKEDFNGFITYIQHPRKHVETFIKEEVQKYILRNTKTAQNILKRNVVDIKKNVNQALFTATDKVQNKKGDTGMWLKEFSNLLKDELTFDTICSQNVSDINSFDFLKEEIERGLVSIMKEMSSLSLNKMKEFRMKPDQILIDQLCNCCWVKCPFCAAVCTNTLENHSPDKHNVPFHRPSGIKGWHIRHTVDLVIDFCTTLVASDRHFYPRHDSDKTVPYKQYQNGGGKYAAWQITPDESKLTYWKWFVCRFQKELEDHYKLKFQGYGEIPNDWMKYKKKDAIKSLDEMYNP
ncbi:interferon-induced very large GTPase 1-like isoform X3 [Channa argus]|uniref:interferon-induced very large GTPase 1-like isoform X3 n=1 Tax=Channa argus TaxID=215402 RepID=UPI003521DF26